MAEPQFLETPQGRRLAYHRFSGREPGVVFLGGLRSDMTGTKAVHLEEWARRSGRAFLRFDYSGHGASSGSSRRAASATGQRTRWPRSRR
jgi:pimeloyl-ACP methyl ester carboxylesterase